MRRRQWHPTPVLLPGKSHGWRSLVGCSPWCGLGQSNFTFTFHLHALEKEMATHSSVLAWRISRTGEPGGLPSMGSHRVGHDWSDLAAAVAAAAYNGYWLRKELTDFSSTEESISQGLIRQFGICIWVQKELPHSWSSRSQIWCVNQLRTRLVHCPGFSPQ